MLFFHFACTRINLTNSQHEDLKLAYSRVYEVNKEVKDEIVECFRFFEDLPEKSQEKGQFYHQKSNSMNLQSRNKQKCRCSSEMSLKFSDILTNLNHSISSFAIKQFYIFIETCWESILMKRVDESKLLMFWNDMEEIEEILENFLKVLGKKPKNGKLRRISKRFRTRKHDELEDFTERFSCEYFEQAKSPKKADEIAASRNEKRFSDRKSDRQMKSRRSCGDQSNGLNIWENLTALFTKKYLSFAYRDGYDEFYNELTENLNLSADLRDLLLLEGYLTMKIWEKFERYGIRQRTLPRMRLI